MKNQIEISVIMPIYNVKEYLEKSISSVINQSFDRYELILVDDGSTDGSSDFIDRYKGFPKIKVIHKKNAGSGASRNTGLEEAKERYVYFMDPDDWLDGEMLRDNYELLIRYSPDFLIFGWFDHAFGRSVPKVFEDDVIESKKEFLEKFPTLFKKDVLYNVWNKLYKRSFLIENKLEFGHEKNGQDYLFNIRVYNKTNSVVINSRRYYHYIVKRPSSATANFHYQIFNLYKKEQIELINLMYKNDIHAPDIVSNRWYFILNNCWLRSRTRDKVLLKKRNKYIQDIIEEYKKYNYIDIKNLSNFKSRIKYLFFFRMGLFKYDFRNLH